MKKIYLLAIGLMTSATITVAQSSLDSKIKFESNNGEVLPSRTSTNRSIRATETCVDTVDYALYRALNSQNQVTYANITLEDSMSTIKGMGLFFPVPAGQTVTMSGFELQAMGIRADNQASQTIVSVYAASPDSLPMGTALTTQTIMIDTNSGAFSDRYMVHTFTDITINSSFVVTVQSGSPTDSVVIWAGGVLSGGFDGYPTSLDFGGNWLRPKGSAQIGEIIPRFHPILSYNATNSLSASVTQLSMANEAVDFTSTYSEIGRSIMSLTGLFSDNNTAAIDFGDGTLLENASTTESHTFAIETSDYTITLTDSILLYQNIYCVLTETVSVLKAYPLGVEDASVISFTAFISNNEIHISNANGLATLYSITGSVVKQFNITNNSEIVNISELNDGVYILSVNGEAIRLKK